MLPEKETVGDLGILYKPDNAHENAIGYGIVEAIGDGIRTKKGVLVPITDLKVGDKVAFIKFLKEVHTNVAASHIIGEDRLLLDVRKDILGVIDD